MSEARPCPLCARPLYGWIALPPADATAGIGMPLSSDPRSERVIDRCEECGVALECGGEVDEECGVALECGGEVDLVAEWGAVYRPGPAGDGTIAIPNRASLQAGIGVEGWAAIGLFPGRLLLTPRSLELLAERNGRRLERLRWPTWGSAQLWMWQTLLNGLTFHPNFAREVWAGRLRPANARGRFAFGVDLVVTVLGAPLVAAVSFPLEAVAALLRRGGEMVAEVV